MLLPQLDALHATLYMSEVWTTCIKVAFALKIKVQVLNVGDNHCLDLVGNMLL